MTLRSQWRPQRYLKFLVTYKVVRQESRLVLVDVDPSKFVFGTAGVNVLPSGVASTPELVGLTLPG